MCTACDQGFPQHVGCVGVRRKINVFNIILQIANSNNWQSGIPKYKLQLFSVSALKTVSWDEADKVMARESSDFTSTLDVTQFLN